MLNVWDVVCEKIFRVQNISADQNDNRSRQTWVILTGHVSLQRGALGHIINRKTEQKNIQNCKTVKKFAQNQKLHTKLSKTDTIVTSGVYTAHTLLLPLLVLEAHWKLTK